MADRRAASCPVADFSALPGDPASYSFVLALSGGLDSTVLAHLADQWVRAHPPARLRLVHVDHAIHPDSAGWAAGCATLADALRWPFRAISAGPIDRRCGGLEAAARDARYAVLRQDLAPDEVLLTAHHLDDQAETVLLALLRASGPAGLAAMPALARFGPGWHLRPLLGATRATLRHYAQAMQLDWLEDPSNSNLRHDRNYLRAQVLPVLASRWPAVAENLAVSARQCAATSHTVRAAMAATLDRLGSVAQLPVSLLREAGDDGAALLMREWLARNSLPTPPRRRLASLLAQVSHARPDGNPALAWPGAEVRRFRDRLYAMAPLDAPPVSAATLRVGETLALPGSLGTLALMPVTGAGIAASAQSSDRFTVRFRTGGEIVRPSGDDHRRRLKRLLNEARIVPWMRARLPLIYRGDALCAVAHLWLDGACAARPGEPGVQPEWYDHPALY